MKASLVVRTLNEARYLPELLAMVARQQTGGIEVETVVVDSGSTDGSTEIARRAGCKLMHIRRHEFSFGRSLNIGCEAATGDLLVFVSGHCIPTDEHWLRQLCAPLIEGSAHYTYGRQIGGPTSRFSECRIFEKYYPAVSAVPQEGFFCNNANAALPKAVWQQFRFDEELTGLEDMELAKRMVDAGRRIGYIAEACVTHHHDETWPQVRRRFEREAIALQKIMPQFHVGLADTARYILRSVLRDVRSARVAPSPRDGLYRIARYRFEQYVGAYRGNHLHRRMSRQEMDRYFYPQPATSQPAGPERRQAR